MLKQGTFAWKRCIWTRFFDLHLFISFIRTHYLYATRSSLGKEKCESFRCTLMRIQSFIQDDITNLAIRLCRRVSALQWLFRLKRSISAGHSFGTAVLMQTKQFIRIVTQLISLLKKRDTRRRRKSCTKGKDISRFPRSELIASRATSRKDLY